jgi:hypothetical protein
MTMDDLLTVHVFVSTGRFPSFEQLSAYIDATYTEDGEGTPSAFMEEVDLHDYQPGCIEAITSESGRPVPVAELVAEASWSERWLPAIDGARTADAVIAVFSPNVVAHPERCSLEYLGMAHFRIGDAPP